MKTILLAVALLFSVSAIAQNTGKPPKFRITKSIFTTKYELGDKDVNGNEIRLHLEKHSPEAYYQWRKAEGAGTTALVSKIIGLGGMIYGLASSDNTQQIIGYGVATTAFTVALVATLSSGVRQEKAVSIYNNKFGY